MYANLQVRYAHEGAESTVCAWSIDRVDGQLVIALDANDGDSNYAVEAGQVTIDPGALIEVGASF